MLRCHTHADHPAAGSCRTCGQDFCEDCLVYAYGEGKQPYCIDCAVTATTHNSWEDRRRVADGAS